MGYTQYATMQPELGLADHSQDMKDRRWQCFVNDVSAVASYCEELRSRGGDMGRVRVDEDKNLVIVTGDDEDNTVEPLFIVKDECMKEQRGISNFTIYCKTGRLDYDAAVLAVLFLFRTHFYAGVSLGTDASTIDELQEGIDLFGAVFGSYARDHACVLARDMVRAE